MVAAQPGMAVPRKRSQGGSPPNREIGVPERSGSAARLRNIFGDFCVPLSRRARHRLWVRDGGRRMPTTRTTLAAPAGLLVLVLAATTGAGCAVGPSVSGSFDRTFSVTAPIRLELVNAAGDVSIIGSTDGKVHVH